MNDIKKTNCRRQKNSFTLTQLKELVTAAQEGNQQAVDKLCQAFKPLIYKEALRQSISSALGEDAVNTAWVIFLEFISKYNGRDYAHLPGLIQCHLRYELLHKLSRHSSATDCLSLDSAAENMQLPQLADNADITVSVENKELSKNAMQSLTARQREIIEAVHFKDISLQAYSKLHRVSYKTLYLHHQRGINKLKQLLG